MSKKIGIITHYYKTSNYGGNLQAYALTFFLNKNGFDAKQICYDYWSSLNYDQFIKPNEKRSFKTYFSVFLSRTLFRNKAIFIKKYKARRAAVFDKFQQSMVPHTDKEYFEHNLAELNHKFDYFVTGSDQVFNFKWFRKAFWLVFASKTKISYAASMAVDKIPADKIEFIRTSLKSFKAIGVREEKTVDLLRELSVNRVQLNVDPTFLLSEDEWNSVSSNRIMDEDYVFCYFLGNNKTSRRLAKKYASLHNLKLVCIPVCINNDVLIDRKLGDINILYASPGDFISLIKNANVVFTDSFHACIFSIIYKKNFVVFNRDSKGTMNTRIESLVKLFSIEKRFINTKEQSNINEIETIFRENTAFDTYEFDRLKEDSSKFLLDNLRD